MPRSIIPLCLIAALTMTGCGLSSPSIRQTPAVPTPLLASCSPPSPPADGRLITISHSLIEAVSAYRDCAQGKDDLIQAVKARQEGR